VSTGRKPTVLVLGGSSSLHARIPAQMVREAGYRVMLANAERTVAPGTEDFFDSVFQLVTVPEQMMLMLRSAVGGSEDRRPVGPMQVVTATRRKSLYARLCQGWLRGRRLAWLVRRLRPGLLHVQSMAVGGMTLYYYMKRMGPDRPELRPGTLVHLFSYQPRYAEIRAREIRVLKACEQVHTSSPVVADIYREHYEVPADKLHLLVRGIDLDTFAPQDPDQLDAARRQWGVPADKFVLIHNRHLHPMYRVDIAVETFIELVRRGHDVFLILVRGSMWEQAYEEQLLGMLEAAGCAGRVALMPHILSARQMAAALQLADCSINTVPFDAFPVSILESMYCHAVPVVRDLDSYSLFVRDGETGMLCGGEGIDDYLRRIELLIGRPELKERIARAGADLVAEKGSAEMYRRDLLDLVRRCYRDW
jgi:glycosyltransferase involved in cell wall biosynthesis